MTDGVRGSADAAADDDPTSVTAVEGDRPSTTPPAPDGRFAKVASRLGVDARGATTGHVVWRAMGGWRGILESTVPSLAFVVLYTATYDPARGTGDLLVSLGVSVGLAVVFTAVRLAMRSPAAPAIGGLVATAAAAGLALWTGRGQDNFLLGFATNGVYGGAFLVSALVGWPLIGLAAGLLLGEGTAWRHSRRQRLTYMWLSIAWAALFAARLAVQLPLYFAGDVTALGLTKIAMGLPLFAPLLAVTWLAVRALHPARLRGSAPTEH